MPSPSERLPFNRGLLLAYLFPLVIWAAASVAAVVTLKEGLRYLRSAESSEQLLRLAGEYREAFAMLRDGEDYYFDDSSPDARSRREEILRQANARYAELDYLTRGREAQAERLQRAGAILQKWFYDVASRPAQQSVDGAVLAQDFKESMTNFIAAERRAHATAKSRFAAMAKQVQWIIWSGLALGVVAKILTARWIATRIGRSVESINQAADELASGNMTARVHGRGEGANLAARFNAMAELIEKRNEQQAVLAELGEMLHNCRSMAEGKDVFGKFVDDLFPNRPGVLYFIESNQKDVTTVATWQDGLTRTRERMSIDECWALRLGRAHQNDVEGKARCDHLLSGEESRCIPLPAFGGVIGLLFLLEGSEADAERERHKRFADAVAEQVALAFANIRLREQLREQSIRDPLTELYNRRRLDEVFENELARSDRHHQPLSVIAFDIDHFKRYNDAHGHDGGDAVLRCIGETLQDFFRPEDGVFRSGGEEFVVLLPDTGLDDAVLRAEELRKEIAGLKVVRGNVHLPPVTISAGVATYPMNGRDAGALLKAADRALYRAKEGGRDRVLPAADA